MYDIRKALYREVYYHEVMDITSDIVVDLNYVNY